MCVKNVTKQFYALMMTSPKLASPVVIQTFQYYPRPEEVQRIGFPHIKKNRDWSLLVHFDEQPQLHVVPINVPWPVTWRDIPDITKQPLLPAPPKVPYLA
jgi:hypothetical protein